MLPFPAYFEPFPPAARKAVAALLAAWLFLIAALYLIYLPGHDLTRQVIAGAAHCLLAILGYNWGRIMCLAMNAMAGIYLLVFAVLLFHGNPMGAAAAVVILALFAAATYYLLMPEAADFYKTFRKPDTDPTPPEKP